ncbi:hypothetical protein [Schlesneria paludicola]|uniref:hypothetical protein n=1 Tax=Schlesneria paludicola TaxID=360056 RepID=UPI00029B080F|nr:hypothetical protein [Schlesneria paludicola]
MSVDRRWIAWVTYRSLLGIIAIAMTSSPPELHAQDFLRKQEIERCIQAASESAKLIHSLHYRMVLRSPDFARELEFWMKDSKYRARVPKLYVRNGGLTPSTTPDDHCGDEWAANNADSWTYTGKENGPSPLPMGLLHLAQFEWLFDDFTAGRWPIVQDPFTWKRMLESNDVCSTVRRENLDGLPVQQIILFHHQSQYRLDVWLAESLGMYPMKIESLDPQRKILHSSVVEKYVTFQMGDQCTAIPTRVRELRTSPISTDDPTYNIFEIVAGSLEINPDFPDELFAAVDESIPEIVESKSIPIRDYRQVPPTEPEVAIAPLAITAPPLAPGTGSVAAPAAQPVARIPVLEYLFAAAAAGTACWGIRHSAARNHVG